MRATNNIIITITINNSNRQKVMGIKYTQHKDISWSKRYRGKVALIHTKKTPLNLAIAITNNFMGI